MQVFARWAGDAVAAETLAVAGEDRLTPAQFRCMDFLARRTNCSVGALADGLAVSDPAATKLVDRLEHKGLVMRSLHQSDKRIVHVSLSPRGASLVGRLDRRRARLIEFAIASVSTRRLGGLVRTMETILMSALDSPEVIRRVCLHCGDGHRPDCIVARAHRLLTGVEVSWR